MLRLLGGPKQLCNGVTRRDLLIAGGLSALSSPFAGHSCAAPIANADSPLPGFGSAKNVILLYLFGGPSHIEICDMKPAAPQEVRGEFRPIASSLPGCDVCEHLPHMARVMDRVSVVRSLTHPWNFHGMQYATTGAPVGSIPLEETLIHPDHQPFLGSVKSYFDRQRSGRKAVGAVPDNLILPFLLSSRRPSPRYAPPSANALGTHFDPIWTEFRGEPTRSALRRSFGPPAEIADPFLGVKPDCRFLIAPEAELPGEVTLDRLHRRRALLEQIERLRRDASRRTAPHSFDPQRELAFSMLDSAAIRSAFAIDQEPMAVREAYGMSLFGQATLQARRLVEAGCRFVTVVWDEFGQLNAGWDTHVDHHNRLKSELLPGLDLAFSSLIHDLEDRGLLDETLVLVMNEMGRTPQFQGEGRGHWGFAYSNFFAGAGMKRGTVVGRTDKIGGTVTDRPLTAKDVLATIYHLVGIDPDQTLNDRLNRPVPLVHNGQVIPELLA
jgi:hypothetical protein